MRENILKAVLCTALFILSSSARSDSMIEHRGLSIDCTKQGSQIQLLFTSTDLRGKVRIEGQSGNRISSSISRGSTVRNRLDSDQFPLMIVYETDGIESELILDLDCTKQ